MADLISLPAKCAKLRIWENTGKSACSSEPCVTQDEAAKLLNVRSGMRASPNGEADLLNRQICLLSLGLH